MTEGILKKKEDQMADCNEKTNQGLRCGCTIYRCKNCGNVGCTRSDCKNSGWNHGTCTKCGKTGDKYKIGV